MDIRADVEARLKALGYEDVTSEEDQAAITYAINRASEQITANINRSEVPEGLKYTWVDMAAGMFLYDKKAAGTLGEAFDFSAPEKRITEGDTTVETFGASDGCQTPESRFDALLAGLIHPPQSIFAAFRRIRW